MPAKPKLPKGLYWRGDTIWARFKVRGVEHRHSLRTGAVSVAEKRLKAIRQEAIDRAHFGVAEPTSWMAAVVSWSTLGARALGIKDSTFDRYKVSLGQLRAWLDPLDIHEVDARLLKTIVKDRQRLGTSNATIRRDLSALASVLEVAVGEGWVEDNAAHGFSRRGLKEARDPIVLPEPEAIAAVLALGSRFVDLAEFSRLTGMRQEEVASLRHDQVDKNRMAVTLTVTKGRRARQVPIDAAALAVIDRQARFLTSPHVFWRGAGERFHNVGSQFHATVKRVARKAAQAGGELRPFRFHDLRHLFAVEYLREGRGSIYELQMILGHTSVKTTEEYLRHLTPEEQLRAKYGGGTKEGTSPRIEAENA